MATRASARRLLLRAGALGAFGVSVAACGARTPLPVETADQPPQGRCGDHVENAGEACDDGNEADDVACIACELARCGDGIVRTGFEGCDDGNTADDDACRNDCSLPTCGDGVVQAGEECDSGPTDGAGPCTPLCLFARCGDGFVQAGVEECDSGAANGDRPALAVVQGPLLEAVTPVARPQSVVSFWAYESASAHTGLEALETSKLFLYRDLSGGALSLCTLHGIDVDTTGIEQPESRVLGDFLHLPDGAFVAVADDRPEEFDMVGATQASGDWKFHRNTDGGAVSGLPFPGDWAVEVNMTFLAGITTWVFIHDAQGSTSIPLDSGQTAIVVARTDSGVCRLDCTVPRCGDGRLDAGETCDDGNTTGGDGCPAGCK